MNCFRLSGFLCMKVLCGLSRRHCKTGVFVAKSSFGQCLSIRKIFSKGTIHKPSKEKHPYKDTLYYDETPFYGICITFGSVRILFV